VSNEEEAEANLFAFHLLMPEEFLRAELRKFKRFDFNNEKHVAELAKKFQVSPAMVGYRLAMLT
jgi:Zn-dependent peptidase ImmA (M78 family)